MFSLAIEAGKLPHKPHFAMLREDNARGGFFERDQYEAVPAHLPEGKRPVVTFAYVTGWRINSEVLRSSGGRSISASARSGSIPAPRKAEKAGCST